MKKLILALFLCIMATVALSSCQISFNPHTCEGIEVVAAEPTCEEDGEMLIVCATCYEILDRQAIPATGKHIYGERVDAEGEYENCTDRPYTQTCTKCGHTVTKPGDVYSHKFTTETIPPTCSERGYDLNICTVCGYEHKNNYRDTLPHDYETEYHWDENYHWLVCKVCSASKTKLVHIEGEDGKCLTCGTQMGYTPGITYKISDDATYAYVASYEGTSRRIRIAPEYKGFPVTHIGDNMEWNSYAAVEIVLTENITYIGKSAFQGKSIVKITNMGNVTYIGDSAFSYCEELILDELPKNLEYIGDTAFYHCKNVKITEIPDSVSYLGENAFAYSGVVEVTVGDSVSQILKGTFSYCESLNSVILGESVVTVGAQAFERSGVKEVVLSDSTVSLSKDAFFGCQRLEKIHFGKSFRTLDTMTFYNCSRLETITLSPENENFCLLDGVLYTKNLETLILYPAFDPRAEFVIPDGVVSICDYGAMCGRFDKVVIPDSVKTIGEYAFSGCYYLKEVVMGDGVVEIKDFAFADCKKLANVKLSESLVTIGKNAFRSAVITYLIIPDSVEIIQDNAFYDCDDLITVVMGKGIKEINTYAFYSAYYLKEFYYCGTAEDLEKVSCVSGDSPVKFSEKLFLYSESEPQSEGNFWHYDEDGNPVKW